MANALEPTALFRTVMDRYRQLIIGPLPRDTELTAEPQTIENWEKLRTAFYALAHDPSSNTRPHFMEFSRWFGTAEHYEGIKPVQDRGIRIVTPMEFPIMVPEGIDPLRFGALYLAYAMVDEPPPIEVGLAKYFAVDPELRTHQTDTMLVVEQVLGAILALDPDKNYLALFPLLNNPILMELLETAFLDLNDLMVEHDSLPSIQYNTIINRLWHGHDSEVRVYRVHINMTSLNELDPTNTQGSLYLAAVKKWLQIKFGESNIVQNPERTSFQFIGVDPIQVKTAVANFELEIKAMMRKMPGAKRDLIAGFKPQIWVAERSITKDSILYYGIATPDDLELFRSILENSQQDLLALYDADTITFETFRVRLRDAPFSFQALMMIGEDDTHPSRLSLLEGLITNALVNFNVELASETTFFEKNYPGQENLYTKKMLDQHLASNPDQVRVWESYVRSRRGYVGVGQYNPVLENPGLQNSALFPNAFHHYLEQYGLAHPTETDNPQLNRLLNMLPRLKHVAGLVSHTRPGSRGALQRMGEALHTFTSSVTDENIRRNLTALQTVTRELRDAFRTVYGHAVTSPRYTWNMKHYKTASIRRGDQEYHVNANLFVQEVAADRHRTLAVVELDSFKAYNATHLSNSPVDPDINGIQDKIYETAATHNLPHPQVDPTAGDHFSFAFTTDAYVTSPQFAQQVQEEVKTHFADKPFQDYHKVTMQLHTFDIPDATQRNWLQNENNLEHLRTTLNLSARPVFVNTHANEVVLAFPQEHMDGTSLSQEQVGEALISADITLMSTQLKTEIQILRLPIWRPSTTTDTDVDPNDLVFSNTAPASFEPFQRTLTVSMVVDSIRPRAEFRTAGEWRNHVEEVQHQLDHRLAGLKQESWPFKGGLEIAYRHGLTGSTRRCVFYGPVPIPSTSPHVSRPVSHTTDASTIYTGEQPLDDIPKDMLDTPWIGEVSANDLITPSSQYEFVNDRDGTVRAVVPENNTLHFGATLDLLAGGRATTADQAQIAAFNRNQWEFYLGAMKTWRAELALTPDTEKILDQLATGERTPDEILDMDNPEEDFLEHVADNERDVMASQLQEIHDTMNDLDYQALLVIARIEMAQPEGFNLIDLYERQYQPANNADILPYRPRLPANTAQRTLTVETLVKA